MVPNGWKEVRLGDVISHQKGFAFKSEHYCDKGKRIIRISDTDRNSIHDKSPVYINENNSVGLERYALFSGDIILSTVGSRPHLLDSMVGKAVQIPPKDEGALLNQNLVKISPKKKLITNNYLFSMLKKNKFNFFISTLVRGNANQVSITLDELFSYKFLLPTYDEQRKIAKILSTWDQAIATTERLIATSQQQKKALMQQLLTGKKRLVNPETGKEFEGDWETVKFSQLAVITMGSSPKSEAYNETGEGLPLLQGNADIKFRRSAPRIYTNQVTKECSIGDILLSVRAPVGSVAKSDHKACIGRGIASVKAKESNSQEYLYQWLLAFEPKWERLSQGSTFEAVNSNDIKTLHILAPNLTEQQKIASVLTAADKEIELLQAKLAHLKDEKKALMQQLLTGKRRVKIDAAEAA